MSDDQDLTRLKQVLKMMGFKKSTKPNVPSNKKDEDKTNLDRDAPNDNVSISDDESSDYQTLPDELRVYNKDERISNNNTSDDHNSTKELQVTEESGHTTFHTSIQNAQQVHVGPKHTNFYIHTPSSTPQSN